MEGPSPHLHSSLLKMTPSRNANGNAKVWESRSLNAFLCREVPCLAHVADSPDRENEGRSHVMHVLEKSGLD